MQQGMTQRGESGYLELETTTVRGDFTQVEVLETSDVTVIARGIRYGRWHLLKALQPTFADQTMYRQMLVKEFNILMQLNHPGVVRAVDFCDVPSLGRCIVMEWIEGETLDEWLIEHPDRKSHRRVIDQLLDAVAHIHSRGIAHRDLKPTNVMIMDNGGQVKVIDFGLADTDAHATLKQPAGTLSYMAPEQQLSRTADVRNDIYSLGMIMGEMNLGWLLRRVAARCLRPIDKRWQSVEQLQRAIAHIGLWRKWLWRVASVIAILALIVGAVMITNRLASPKQSTVVPDSLRHSLERIDSLQMQQSAQATQQAAQAEEQKQRIDEVSQALGITQASNQAIERQQQAAAAHQQRVAAAVSRGKALVDQAMRATGIKEHLDTLSRPKYVRQGFNYDLLAGKRAIDSYLASLQGQFDAADLSAINQQLISYWQTHWLDPLNKKLM